MRMRDGKRMDNKHLQRLVHLLAALMTVVVLWLGGATAAWADDNGAQPNDCDPSNQQDHAGSGMPGWIDDQPTGGAGTTLYEQYGWSGMNWSTCQLAYNNWGPDIDIHMPPMVQNPSAWIDTHLGNIFMGISTTLGAAMTQLNEWTTTPSKIMAPVDSALAGITQQVRDSTWAKFVGIIVIATACVVVVWVGQGNIRRALSTVVAILIASLMVAAIGATYTQPPNPDNGYTSVSKPGAEYLGEYFDYIASGVIGSVSQASTGGTTPNIAYGATLYDQILVPIWVDGAVGVSCPIQEIQAKDGSPYGNLCYDIYHANSTPYGASTNTPVDDYKAIAVAITGQGNGDRTYYAQSGGPITTNQGLVIYDTLRGVNGGRAALGFKAMVTMIMIAIIRIPCSILLLMGLLVIRFVVMFIPIWALFAIPEATRGTAKSAGKMVLAAVYNAAVFGVFGIVHTMVTAKIIASNDPFTPGNDGFTISKLILIIALTLVTWVVSKPFRSVTVPATGDVLAGVGLGAAAAMRHGGSVSRRLAGGAIAGMSVTKLGQIGKEEEEQTKEAKSAQQAVSSEGSTQKTNESYAVEPQRMPQVKFRNVVKQVQRPVHFRRPVDLSDVDKTTGEIHPHLQNPVQFQKPVAWQAPVYLQSTQPLPPPAPEPTPSAPPQVFPGAMSRETPEERIARIEHARQREQIHRWRPSPALNSPSRVQAHRARQERKYG